MADNLFDHEQDSGGFIDYLTGLLGGKAIVHNGTPPQPQQMAQQGYPGAQVPPQSEMNLEPGQSEFPAWGNAPGTQPPPQPPPWMQPPQQPPQAQQLQQQGGFVNTLTSMLASPLFQAGTGAAGGALIQPRHAGTRQMIGGALLGGTQGFNIGQNQQLNQQFAAQQQTHQQFLEQQQRQQMLIQQWRQIQEEALLARQTQALQAIPEKDRPYIELGQRPPQPQPQSEAKLAYEAEEATPEGERAGRALKRLQDVKASEKNAPTAASEETARHNKAEEAIHSQAEAGRNARSARRDKERVDQTKKEDERDKRDTQNRLERSRKEYLAERPPDQMSKPFDQQGYRAWLQETYPSVYDSAVRHKLIGAEQKATFTGQAGGSSLEQKYPALTDKIKQARAAGYSEADIEKYLQGKK